MTFDVPFPERLVRNVFDFNTVQPKVVRDMGVLRYHAAKEMWVESWADFEGYGVRLQDFVQNCGWDLPGDISRTHPGFLFRRFLFAHVEKYRMPEGIFFDYYSEYLKVSREIAEEDGNDQNVDYFLNWLESDEERMKQLELWFADGYTP